MMNLDSSFDTSKSSDRLLQALKSELSRRLRENRLNDYRPYPKREGGAKNETSSPSISAYGGRCCCAERSFSHRK
jgi:hypothetical protein